MTCHIIYIAIYYMINPREFIRRLIKFAIMFLILVLALYNTRKLNRDDIIVVSAIVTITYCLVDTMAPAINIVKSADTDQ